MGWVVRLVSEIRAIRSEMNVPVAAEIPLLVKGQGPRPWRAWPPMAT